MQKHLKRNNSKGFTLIEIIIVIIVLGILAVSAGPRIFSGAGVNEIALEAKTISLLRLQQQLAMQDSAQHCYGVNVLGQTIQPFSCGVTIASDKTLTFANGIQINSVIVAANSGFRFNSLGCPVSTGHDSNPEPCGSEPIQIDILGNNTRSLCIQSQGFIRRGEC